MLKDQWQKVIDTNLTGVFLCSRIFSKTMIHKRKGKLLIFLHLKDKKEVLDRVIIPHQKQV